MHILCYTFRGSFLRHLAFGFVLLLLLVSWLSQAAFGLCLLNHTFKWIEQFSLPIYILNADWVRLPMHFGKVDPWFSCNYMMNMSALPSISVLIAEGKSPPSP